MTRALFCGDRNWSDGQWIRQTLEDLLEEYPDLEICEGEARGADTLARQAAEKLGIKVTPFPAQWAKFGRAAGPIRNRQMLDEFHPDIVMAFHNDIEHSKGTKDMVTEARKRGIPTFVFGGARP